MGWGGQEVRVLVELEWMRAHGHWVALAAHPESGAGKQARQAGIELYPISARKGKLPLELIPMARWISRNKIDVVNTHSSNDGWLVGLAARLARRPILIRSRHVEVDYPSRFRSGLAFRSLPHHLITTSQRIANRVMEELSLPAWQVTCIATGIDLNKFNPAVNGTLREELGLKPEVALVGMVAVLRSWKGHPIFIQSMEHVLKASRRPVRFIIAGDGPGRQELAETIARMPWKEHVTMLGHRTDVPNVVASLDVLVLPSYAHEGIPQIILQAQATGRAVVGTTVGGIPEVVEDDVTGLLVPPRNPEALAEKISALLNDAALRERLGTASRAQMEKHYGVDSMGERLLALYEEVSHRRGQ